MKIYSLDSVDSTESREKQKKIILPKQDLISEPYSHALLTPTKSAKSWNQ